jgi:hypothetical protein
MADERRGARYLERRYGPRDQLVSEPGGNTAGKTRT